MIFKKSFKAICNIQPPNEIQVICIHIVKISVPANENNHQIHPRSLVPIFEAKERKKSLGSLNSSRQAQIVRNTSLTATIFGITWYYKN